MTTLLGQEIVVGKRYVYLKNARTGSSTERKLKMIGICKKDTGKMQFYCEWAEGYNHLIGSIHNILNPKDVICEYTIIGKCKDCAYWYKEHCSHGPCATEPTNADFFCGDFEPKCGEENG